MKSHFNLSRFLEAQETTYKNALKEVHNGQKKSHWMWFIFPQIKGLGFSEQSNFYGLEGLEEAQHYYNDPILGKRLIEITQALLSIENKSVLEIMGSPDDKKLKSCMTLFSKLPNALNCFQLVLHKYYDNQRDNKTLVLIK